MRQWTVDAFAAVPFKGNPACVVEPFNAWPMDAWMQSLAAENNQAETAFLLRTADPDRFGLRWFTPTVEVPLCGHATLASSHVLFAELANPSPAIRFETLKSGTLTVKRLGERIEMDFPADPPHRIAEPEGLAQALGARPVEVWAGRNLIAVLDSEEAVRALRPDLAQVAAIGAQSGAERGNVSVVATADPERDYAIVSRFFAPGSGIPEDPTTGGAHTMLAPLYAAKLDRARLLCHQAYPGRGGDLEVELKGGRVLLRGAAVTVVESRLRFQEVVRRAAPLIQLAFR